MTGLPDNVDKLLARLAEDSSSELNLVRTLADAIRRADEQVLREVRTITVHHEMRREEIMGELHTLAARLCAMPARPIATAPRATINYQEQPAEPIEPNQPEDYRAPIGGDWRQAAQKIDDELERTFGGGLPRH